MQGTVGCYQRIRICRDRLSLYVRYPSTCFSHDNGNCRDVPNTDRRFNDGIRSRRSEEVIHIEIAEPPGTCGVIDEIVNTEEKCLSL